MWLRAGQGSGVGHSKNSPFSSRVQRHTESLFHRLPNDFLQIHIKDTSVSSILQNMANTAQLRLPVNSQLHHNTQHFAYDLLNLKYVKQKGKCSSEASQEARDRWCFVLVESKICPGLAWVFGVWHIWSSHWIILHPQARPNPSWGRTSSRDYMSLCQNIYRVHSGGKKTSLNAISVLRGHRITWLPLRENHSDERQINHCSVWKVTQELQFRYKTAQSK